MDSVFGTAFGNELSTPQYNQGAGGSVIVEGSNACKRGDG